MLGGINRLDTVEHALCLGFEFVAMARALLREPGLVDRLREDQAREGLCIHCMKCMPTVYSGTHCVLRGTEGSACGAYRSGDPVNLSGLAMS